ncbi:response regulator [Pleurocapsales cyanobacterium LEGE 10410]|nr:response regulator [Pleurocapsales cyanobacterium LEGE 10410]
MSEEQLSILLVDDDEVDRLTVGRALKKAGVTVKLAEAENGAEALSLLKNWKNNLVDVSKTNLFSDPVAHTTCDLDLILLDYRLPDIDGLQLIADIRALNLNLPLIVLTGQGDEKIAVEIMKAGAADYLAKSRIEPNTLAKAINGAIRIHQAEQAAELANQRLRVTNELLVIKNQELEKQQQQIKRQNIQLQKAYNLKSEFLATMSHELRTPMNAIMGFSQLLLRQYPDPLSAQQQNLVQRIFNNSKSLLDMINEMLDFSKIEAGKLKPIPQKFDLSNLINSSVEELRSLAVQKQLDLGTQIELKDSCLFQDFHFVKRTLINLISNAIKFTESGAVTVRAWEIEQTQIAIAVCDTGIGIAPQDRDKIFEAFRQADQSFTRHHSGTGLGLAITQSLVRMMGGEISLQSELGSGSTFTVKIPRRYDA